MNKLPKLSNTQINALRYWNNTDAAHCYKGGNRATLASLVRRGFLSEPRGMSGHQLTEAGREALACFA